MGNKAILPSEAVKFDAAIVDFPSFVHVSKKIALIVDSSFEVMNGLSGLQRDIIIKLCWIIWSEEKKIRMIFAVCGEYFEWRRSKDFIKARPLGIVISLRPNPVDGCAIDNTPLELSSEKPHYKFTTDECRTVFLNQAMVVGVFRWTVQIFYDSGKSSIYLGAAPQNLLGMFDKSYLGDENVKGAASLEMNGEARIKPTYFSGNLSGVEYGYTGVSAGLYDSLVSIETDSAAHTLSFFVGNAKMPHAISGMSTPLHFGVSSKPISESGSRSSFTSVSFRRLPSATPSAIVCTMHKVNS